jgi:hypothetical protein
MNTKYVLALQRNDLSQWLVHFCKPTNWEGRTLSPFEALKNIIKTGRIKASSKYIYDPKGAACFYDVPPQNWVELIQTNPNGRRGYGLIVSKTAFWYKGGRPCIYTDNINDSWPESVRYLLIYTDLAKTPQVDWTHEREWRIKGDFTLEQIPDVTVTWWWPCVEKKVDAQEIFRDFDGIHSIYIIELNRVIVRNEIST